MSLLLLFPSGTQNNHGKMENKKKRGSNFTPTEKATLLKFIQKYKQIIEDKGTNASITLQKREAWEMVTKQYNAIKNPSGTRTWQQLRHLYENIKQRTKRKIIKENRNQEKIPKVLEIKKEPENEKEEMIGTPQTPVVYKSEPPKPVPVQILPALAPKVQPLQNAYDDAAFYFVQTASLKPEVLDIPAEKVEVDVDVDNEYIPFNSMDAAPSTLSDYDGADPLSPILDDETSGTNTSHIPMISAQDEEVPKKRKPNQQNKKNISIKEQYFKTKLRNAILENRYLHNKHKMDVNKYKLEIEILKLRLKKLQSQ